MILIKSLKQLPSSLYTKVCTPTHIFWGTHGSFLWGSFLQAFVFIYYHLIHYSDLSSSHTFRFPDVRVKGKVRSCSRGKALAVGQRLTGLLPASSRTSNKELRPLQISKQEQWKKQTLNFLASLSLWSLNLLLVTVFCLSLMLFETGSLYVSPAVL